MDLVKNWWYTSSKKEKTVQVLVVLLVFTYSAYINNASISIAAGLAATYILYDCYQKKSFSGLRMERENWLGLAVFLGSVLLASLLLGDKPSIHMAFKYVYWALPFLLVSYLGKLADVRYAAAAGGLLSVAVTSVNVAYLNYLFLHGHKLVGPGGPIVDGRLGAFLSNPNHYSVLLICTLPLLLCFYMDKKLRSSPLVFTISIIVTILGLWSLWKTGSRGAMIGLLAGGLSVFALFCFFQKQGKLFLNGLTVGAAIVAVVLLAGIQGGEIRKYSDAARLRQVKSCYAMWQDHKLLGVGLGNWQKEYAAHYVLKDEIRQEILQRYFGGKKAATKQEADRIAAWQNAAIKHESAYPTPHNVFAWFFSTTGALGGIGYLLFVVYYCKLLCSRIKDNSKEWILYVGVWALLAITIHGLVDVGITNKEAARLVFLILGIALNFRHIEKSFCFAV